MKGEQWFYLADVVRVIDGDTVELDIDLGFHIRYKQKVRFYGVDAPEMRTLEGVIAKKVLEELIPPGTRVEFESFRDKPDKYGRLLGTIYKDGMKV